MNPTIVAAIIGAVATISAAFINRSKSERDRSPSATLPQYPTTSPRRKSGSNFAQHVIAVVVLLIVLGIYGEKGLYILGGLLAGTLAAIIAWKLLFSR